MALLDKLIRLLGLDLDIVIDDLNTDRLSAITPTLYVGERPTPNDTQALRDEGITHIVSCLEPEDRPKVAFLEEAFTPLFLPLRDGIQHDIASTFPTFFDFATQATSDGKLLVHCERGVSRSGTLAVALVMKSERRTFIDAYTAVRAKRVGVLPNIGFATQLQRLERQLQPDLDAQPSSLARYLREVCKVPVEVEVIQDMLEHHDEDAPRALRAIFGDDIPRVVQGVRL